MPGHPRSEPVWGDGFCDDTFIDLIRVGDWSGLCSDEYVLFYPRLGRAEGGRIAEPVLDHVRLVMASSGSAAARRERAGRRTAPTSGPRLFAWLRRSDVAARGPIDSDDARLLFHVLDRILVESSTGIPTPYDRSSAMRLAFDAGLNPGYVWAEAIVEPEATLLAGWLGHIDRGRRALVPAVLADLLSRLTLGDVDHLGAGIFGRIAADLQGGALNAIRFAAERKLDGRDVVVQFRRRSMRRAAPGCTLRMPDLHCDPVSATLSPRRNFST